MAYHFFSGLIAAGYFVVSLFFLRFWKRTKLGLFGWFCLAFFVLGLQPTLKGLFVLSDDQEAKLFLIRFAGFLLIIGGIVWANRKPRA